MTNPFVQSNFHRIPGNLEQKADLIILLHSPKDITGTQVLQRMVEAWIGKNRFGPRDVRVGLRYALMEQWFYDK